MSTREHAKRRHAEEHGHDHEHEQVMADLSTHEQTVRQFLQAIDMLVDCCNDGCAFLDAVNKLHDSSSKCHIIPDLVKMLLVMARIDEPGRQAILNLDAPSPLHFKLVVVALASTCSQRLHRQLLHPRTSTSTATSPPPAAALVPPPRPPPPPPTPTPPVGTQSVGTQTEPLRGQPDLAQAAVLDDTRLDAVVFEILMERITQYRDEIGTLGGKLRECRAELAERRLATPRSAAISTLTPAADPHRGAQASTSASTEQRAAPPARFVRPRLSDEARRAAPATVVAHSEHVRVQDSTLDSSPGQPRRSDALTEEHSRSRLALRFHPGSISRACHQAIDTASPCFWADQGGESDSEAEAHAESGDDSDDGDDSEEGDNLDNSIWQAESRSDSMGLVEPEVEDQGYRRDTTCAQSHDEAEEEGEEASWDDALPGQRRGKRESTSTYYRKDRRHRDANRNVRKAHAQIRLANGKFAPKGYTHLTSDSHHP